VVVVYDDVGSPSGRSEQAKEFTDPSVCLEWARLTREADPQPLELALEAFAKPDWHKVDEHFLRWRAARRVLLDNLRAEVARAPRPSPRRRRTR
jgi:hypothetical protein